MGDRGRQAGAVDRGVVRELLHPLQLPPRESRYCPRRQTAGIHRGMEGEGLGFSEFEVRGLGFRV